jgi:hypothetical protein
MGVTVEMRDSIVDQIEAMLLGFFGSMEDAMKYGHLYVLEQEPVEMEMTQMADFQGNDFKYRAEVRMRLRPKTQQELEEDRRD